MNKFIYLTLVLTALLTAWTASAHPGTGTRDERFQRDFPYKYEVRIGWAGYPILDDSRFTSTYRDVYIPYEQYGDLDALYGTSKGNQYMTGLISAEFSVHFKRWFTLAVEAGVNGIWGSQYSRYDGSVVSRNHGAIFTLIPHARFYWLNRKNVRMYSGVGIGISAGKYVNKEEAYLTGQLNPVGITAGRKIFFFGETAIGSSYMGGKFGVGYRF